MYILLYVMINPFMCAYGPHPHTDVFVGKETFFVNLNKLYCNHKNKPPKCHKRQQTRKLYCSAIKKTLFSSGNGW